MRLIECDRCGAEESIPAKEWGLIVLNKENIRDPVLCPACVKRALEKPRPYEVLNKERARLDAEA